MRIALLLAFFATSAHAADKCPTHIAGSTINWALEICERLNETDDELHPGVMKCLDKMAKRDHIPKSPAVSCKLNLKYKTEVCRSMVAHKHYKTVAACVKTPESIPHQVLYGVGG